MDQFPVIDNCLNIGGLSLTELARQVGSTPFYAYDRNLITRTCNTLKAALPDRVNIHYAIKANPLPGIVNHLAEQADGLDIASGGELEIALNSGTKAENISFAGPAKSNQELEAAIIAGVIINMESEQEMQRIATIAQSIGKKANVAIRVNPDFELKTAGMRMAGGAKPFGVDAERVPNMLEQLSALKLSFKGFHIYSGSQNLNHDAIIQAHDKTFELAISLARHAPAPMTWLNIGGGFGIPYFPGEKRLNIQPIADNLQHLLEKHHAELQETEIVMELGRYLVGEAGIYVCTVVDVKESRGTTYAIANGGLHHHLSVSGNFGQVLRKNYPVCIGNRVEDDNIQPISVVGPLCTPLDILADNYELPLPKEGDLFVAFQSGAYGFSASPHRFLSHPDPVEVVV